MKPFEKMFSVSLSRQKEFSVIGLPNTGTGKTKFQGLVNGVPFTQSFDYEKVRARIMKAVEINKHEDAN